MQVDENKLLSNWVSPPVARRDGSNIILLGSSKSIFLLKMTAALDSFPKHDRVEVRIRANTWVAGFIVSSLHFINSVSLGLVSKPFVSHQLLVARWIRL